MDDGNIKEGYHLQMHGNILVHDVGLSPISSQKNKKYL